MVVERGDIWWASMGMARGSEPAFRRPIVIVSSNEFNASLIQTVLAVVLTSNIHLAKAPGNFIIKKSKLGLNRDSVLNVSQLITVDKSFLAEQTGALSRKQIRLLNDGLKLVLDI